MIRAALLVLALLSGVPAHARPERIASLNLCTDLLLWQLADREQIASLSFLSADPELSLIAGEIKGVPINYGRAEEVRLMDPDLILAGTYGARFAVDVLRRKGYLIVEVPPAMSLDEVAPSIELVGLAIGQEARAREMAARVSARNLAAESGFKDWVPLGVEGLLDLDPDIVVVDASSRPQPSVAHSVLDHRALRHFADEGRLIRVESKVWSCGTEETLDAVDTIRAAILARKSRDASRFPPPERGRTDCWRTTPTVEEGVGPNETPTLQCKLALALPSSPFQGEEKRDSSPW